MVDATDRIRMDDCKAELKGLLLEEVCPLQTSILIANKPVAFSWSQSAGLSQQDRCGRRYESGGSHTSTGSPEDLDTSMGGCSLQCHDRCESRERIGLGGARCKRSTVLVLRYHMLKLSSKTLTRRKLHRDSSLEEIVVAYAMLRKG